MATQKTGSTVDVFGFKLGGSYQDAVAQAERSFQLQGDGEMHEGRGTLDGMPGTITLGGARGVLHDVQLRVTVDQGDSGLDGSKPLTRLQTQLGNPSAKDADHAEWRTGDWEVHLYREVIYAKGDDTPRVQYELRGRANPEPSTGPDPADVDEKAREQGAH